MLPLISLSISCRKWYCNKIIRQDFEDTRTRLVSLKTKTENLIGERKRERKKGRKGEVKQREKASASRRSNRIQRSTYMKFSPATISPSTPEVTHTILIHYHSSRPLHSELGVGLRKLRPPSVVDGKEQYPLLKLYVGHYLLW